MVSIMNRVAQNICPPLLWNTFGNIKGFIRELPVFSAGSSSSPSEQELEVYWNPQMAQMLEEWGEGTVWNEIQYLLVNCEGKVLDIACGTGITMEANSKFTNLQLYGCDISDFLVKKAVERGLREDRLVVCDATNMPYEDDYFDYAYSIGSMEHFTEDGMISLLNECKRTVKRASFHMVPVSRDRKNHGWGNTFQSYHKNSE